MSSGFLDLLPTVAHERTALDSGKFGLCNDGNMSLILTAAARIQPLADATMAS